MLLVEEAQERGQIALVLDPCSHLFGGPEGCQGLALHRPHIGILNVIEATHCVILLDLSNDRRDVLAKVLAQLEGVLLLALLWTKLLNPLLVGGFVNQACVGLLRCVEIWLEPREADAGNLLVFAPSEDVDHVGSIHVVLMPVNRLKNHLGYLSSV